MTDDKVIAELRSGSLLNRVRLQISCGAAKAERAKGGVALRRAEFDLARKIIDMVHGEAITGERAEGGGRRAAASEAIERAARYLFDNRLGWSDDRQPYAPRSFWADLGAALYGESDERVQELRGIDQPATAPAPQPASYEEVSDHLRGWVFSRVGATGHAIIHPRDEPDMQSSLAIPPASVAHQPAPVRVAYSREGTGYYEVGPQAAGAVSEEVATLVRRLAIAERARMLDDAAPVTWRQVRALLGGKEGAK